ncbi:MAG: hypothetical protein BGO14_00240 [Chlamydiales bacterium 38-26]|nr:BON domain-containing protein [Chlamydiales bacterium]OJV07158.1 MAG: hypothetical protein BGO14_00240 [Chlamydiales bacterium 38-26]
MKNLSKLLIGTIAILASSVLLNAQNTSTQSGFSNPSSTTYPNPSSTSQTGTNPSGQNQWNTNAQTQNPNTRWGNEPNQSQSQWGNQPNPSLNTNSTQQNPNQPYTQPSNVPTMPGKTSYNASNEKKNLAMSDEDISQKIRWSIRDDKTLQPESKNAQVTVNNGNVSLSGSVMNEEDKAKISSLVREIQGVKSVSNNLNVSNK